MHELHKKEPKKNALTCSLVDFLFPAPCRQIYTVGGNHDGGDAYIQTVKFPLVIGATTGGFHVEHHCLISECMPQSVLHHSLYSYCCLQCL